MPKLLVVDDSPMVRQQVGRVLAAVGFTIVEAVDGTDALARLGDSPDIRLVMYDMNVPRMGGIEFLVNVRRQWLPPPSVVMLTTEGHPHLIRKAKALGAKGWLVKPFKPDLLVTVASTLAANPA